MKDLERFLEECDNSPRLNEMANFFKSTAAGISGQPVVPPVADRRLLRCDDLMDQIIDLHARRQGQFDKHYHSSIPYRLEEECRMAYAILKFARGKLAETKLYSLGTAEGTMARTLSELSGGKIQSLSCSPNEENQKSFLAHGVPPHAEFFVGAFHRLSKEYMCCDERLQRFSDGFDFVLEDTTFQMYSANRQMQIEFVAQNLKPGGIFLFVEKFRAPSDGEYQAREFQKDFGFKARFFPPDAIKRKAGEVLVRMYQNEVTLQDMAKAVYSHFRYCVVTWNSGNFYGLAASNHSENLERYLSHLVEPAIPKEYTYAPEAFTAL